MDTKNIAIPSPVHKRAKSYSDATGLKLQEVAKAALTHFLDRMEPKIKKAARKISAKK